MPCDMPLPRLVGRPSGATRPPPLGPSCSQLAHRRCAYSWTAPHTSVVSMQVKRTMVDASYVVGRAGGVQIPALCPLLAPRANHRIDRSVSCPSLDIRRPPDRPRRCRSHSASSRRPGAVPPRPSWRPGQPGCRPGRATQRPGVGQIGQVTCREDQLAFQRDAALEGPRSPAGRRGPAPGRGRRLSSLRCRLMRWM